MQSDSKVLCINNHLEYPPLRFACKVSAFFLFMQYIFAYAE